MKLLLLGVSFPLLLFSFLLGKDASNWTRLSPSLALAKDKNRANASLGKSQQLKPLPGLPWIYMYTPVRSCHQELREKYGEFFPPEYPNGFEGNIWCNWTVWAGARKHIVIYIKGFKSDEGCDKNKDKIFFNGVSSLAENKVVYACWKKEMHVFATYAQGVHVVFLMGHSTNPKREGFMGRYYTFKHRETKPPDKDALDSKLPAPDPSQPTINSISLSQKWPFIFIPENDNLSSSHRIDKTTDLPKTLQTKEGYVSVSSLASKFVWQVTSSLPLRSESLHLLQVSMGSEESSCSQKPSEQLMEVSNPNVWGMGIEEMSVELGEPAILSKGLSEVPYLDLSLIEPSGPVGGMDRPNRTRSTGLVSFLKGDLQIGSTTIQPDYYALDTNSWSASHDPMASAEVSTWDFEEIIPMSCQTRSLAHEVVSTDAIDLEAISLLTPEQDLIGPKIHTDYALLPSEASEGGGLQGYPGSLELLLSDVKLASDWEIETACISEHAAKVLDVYPVLESSGEMASELKATLAASVLCSILEGDLHMRQRSEQSSVEISLDILSEKPGGSSRTDLESSQLLDATIKPGFSLFPSKTAFAPCSKTSAGLGLSPSLLLGTKETLLLPTIELEPLHSYSPTVSLFLAVPDPDSTTLEQKHALSSMTTLTYRFVSIDTILSTPAMPLESTLSEQESIASSVIAETLSLGAEELGPSILAMEHAWSQNATAYEMEMSATVLEPVLSPTSTIKSPMSTETISAFSHVNEIVPTFDFRLDGADPAVAPWSSCCRAAIGNSEQEDTFLATVWSASLPEPVMDTPYSNHHTAFRSTILEHLFPSTEVSASIYQPLLERRDDDDDGSAARPGDKEAHITPLNLAFKSDLFPSFDRFTLLPLNGFSTEMPQFVPTVGEKKQPESLAEYSSVSSLTSTLSSLRSEMQTQVMQPITSWGRPQNTEWNLAGNSLDFTVADLNVVGTYAKSQTEKEPLDLQTIQISSDFENKVTSKAGHLGNHMELELPWLLAYLPAKSCHDVLKDKVGTFSPPVLSSMQSNIWCNWTIWAGPQKHILIYIEGFEGNCEENRDKIIFQGVSSSVESKVVYACRNHGTLVFATQAVAVHVVLLSAVSSQNLDHKHFKGQYYIFSDYETSNLTDGIGDTEEPVLKSNSSTIFSPKSYAVHSGHVLDFVKMSRKLSNETRMPVSSRQAGNNSGNAMRLQAPLSMPLSNVTQASPLKSTENVTLDVNMIQVAKLSFDDRTEIKTLVFGSENMENEEKVILYKPTIPPASPYLSQKFRTMTKFVPVKDTGIVSEFSRSEVANHRTTHQRSAHMKDTGRTVFGKYILQNSVTFPQVSLEEQEIPIPPPESIPVEKQEQVLRALASYEDFSRKTTKAMNFKHLELKEAPEGEQRDNQDYRRHVDNGQYVAVAAAKGRNKSRNAEFLTTRMPENVAIKRKSHLTTLGSPNVLSAPPPKILNSDLMGIASLNSWDVLLSNLRNVQVETTIASYPSSSGNTEHLLQKGTTPKHPDSVPDLGSSNEASLGEKHKNSYENISDFRLYENYTILNSQHNPGDVLFEITFGIDHQGEIPHNGSEQEKALIESIKLQVQEKVKLFSSKVKEIGLKEIIKKEENEMRRGNSPNLIFTFWLHLKPEEKNISHFIHSQLKDLSGESMGAGEIQLVSVGDVNECSSGIGLCGDEAICLNGYGTYICQCKEEYEDRSLTKLGTLCVHSPKSGIGSLYSYAEILVGTTVFFIFVLVVVVSVLCSIVKKSCTKEDGGFEQSILSGTRAHLQPTAFQQDNISNLLSLDPAKLKLRAKSPDWPLQPRTSPNETYRISVEQSECF